MLPSIRFPTWILAPSQQWFYKIAHCHCTLPLPITVAHYPLPSPNTRFLTWILAPSQQGWRHDCALPSGIREATLRGLSKSNENLNEIHSDWNWICAFVRLSLIPALQATAPKPACFLPYYQQSLKVFILTLTKEYWIWQSPMIGPLMTRHSVFPTFNIVVNFYYGNSLSKLQPC